MACGPAGWAQGNSRLPVTPLVLTLNTTHGAFPLSQALLQQWLLLADDGGKRWPGAGLSTSPALLYLNPLREIPKIRYFTDEETDSVQ